MSIVHLNRVRGVSSELHQVARTHRENMTAAEQTLWTAISRKQLNGLRFRSQHCIGQVILDFYCPEFKLAIEVDGSSHNGRAEADAARTAILAAYGISIIRFTNEQVIHDITWVLKEILVTTGKIAAN